MPIAMIYSLNSTLVKSNAAAMNGTSHTSVVRSSAAKDETSSAQLREPIVKRLPRCERMFRLWKISAMDMVRNAMVVPSGLRPFAGISHTPDSMKWPMK